MFARTQRLFLRPLWREDAARVAAGIGNWNIVSKLARAPWPYGLADAERFIEAQTADAPHRVSCGIFLRGKADCEHVGGLGIGPGPHGLYQTDVELGYWIAEPYWGRGIAVEASRAMLDIAFLALGRKIVNSAHFLDNPGSGRVLRKLGFPDTGRVRAHPCLARGRRVACAEYELTREEWCAARAAARH